MDTGVYEGEGQELSLKLIKKADNICIEEADREVNDPSRTTKEGNEDASLGPITPDANSEIGEFHYNCISPSSAVKKPPEMPHFDPDSTINQDILASLNVSSPRTPNDCVFNSFAPGPEDMVFALSCRKYFGKMRTSVARCLNFEYTVRNVDSAAQSKPAESMSDEEMFESLYENILEAIVSNQAHTYVAKFSNIEFDPIICKTPPLVPCLSGAVETCPGAPIKPAGVSRKIAAEICRKLEFYQ